jgi:ArsR family transcriptional regulator
MGAAMKDVARLFKALSDETRLRIFRLLLDGELCICDLMEVLELPQSKVSRHMAYLKHSGLVNDRREGVWIYYSLKEPQSKLHEYQLRCMRDCFEEHEILKRDLQRLKSRLEVKKACAY